jgi:hypothetical protein
MKLHAMGRDIQYLAYNPIALSLRTPIEYFFFPRREMYCVPRDTPQRQFKMCGMKLIGQQGEFGDDLLGPIHDFFAARQANASDLAKRTVKRNADSVMQARLHGFLEARLLGFRQVQVL